MSATNLDSGAVEDVIEYCPESPNASLEDAVTRVFFVCSLCLRQYTLVEDLRGHMIEYHKYKPVAEVVGPKVATVVARAEDAVAKPAVATAPICPKIATESINQTATVVAAIAAELRPMPFKDFRMVLRSKMTMRCSVTYSCPYKFEDTDKLALHAKCHTAAGSAQQFKCAHCSLEFGSWRRCSAHLWKAHEVDVDLLHCPQCAYKAHASVLVWRHMRAHKKWRPRVLRSLRAVQQRRSAQNVQKSNDSAQAPPANKNRYYSEKTCEICGRKFVNGKTLSKHVKAVHNKIKPFICNVCGKKTARKASLIIHMRQHTGEKPLQCGTCKFATRDPSVLHKHQQRHENSVGKFKCALCDYASIQTNAYKRHMRLNHPEEYSKIACDLCSYVTISAERLRVHKDDHGKGLIVNREDSMDATRMNDFKNPRKLHDKNNEISADCFLPLESIDSLPHEPAVDTGGVTIPAPSEDTQFPTYLNN